MLVTVFSYADALYLWFQQAGVDKNMTVLGSASAAFVACLFVARLAAGRRLPERLPALAAAQLPALSAGPPLAAEVARSAAETGVPVAPLNAILVKLRDAGVGETELPQRLQGAAEELARLRSSLADVRAEALPLIDSGDLDAASEALHPAQTANEDDVASRSEGARLYAAAAAIDQLRLDYQAAASKYAAAAALAAAPAADGEPGPARDEWGFRMDQARALSGDGREFNNRGSFAAAIDVYQRALSLAPRPQAPQEWAATHFHLANTLLAAGECDKDPDRLEAAIDAYLLALEEWTRERAPFDWARVQNSLGDALHLLGESENGGDWLAPAAEAYRAALQEWTRDAAPALWTMAQGSLADALLVMGVRGGDRDRLEEAVAAYRAVLDGQDRALAPLDWAMTQNNLGNALLALAERDGSVPPLKEAAAAYRAALEARAKAGEPIEAAKIKVSLAYALGALGSRTRRRRLVAEAVALLDAAIAVFKEAGEERPLSDAEATRQTLLSTLGRAA